MEIIKIVDTASPYKKEVQVCSSGKYLGDFIQDIDGYYYFWISEYSEGCWGAHELIEIGEKLKAINKPYDDELKKYFENESNSTK